MAFITAAFIAAPIVYQIVKHYVPEVGTPERIGKEKTGLAKLEKKYPVAYAIGMTAAEIAITKKVTPKGSAVKGASKSAKFAKGSRVVKKTKKTKRVSSGFSPSLLRGSTSGGQKAAKVSLRATKIKSGTRVVIRRGTAGSAGGQSTRAFRSRTVNRWTGKKIVSKTGKKYRPGSGTLRDIAKGGKFALKHTAKGTKSAAIFVKKHPRFIIRSWMYQRIGMRISELSGQPIENYRPDIPLF